jgi:DNA invertase Pin-like site-specific DNA recombinase
MAIYGYARVSSTDQDLSIQHAALTAAGCEIIRAEKVSGTKRDGRTELATLLDFVRAGDVLVVTRIDRLARSLRDLCDLVHELEARGVSLRATQQPIDTGSAAGKAFLGMLGVFGEFETNLRRERQLEGIARAKAAGRVTRYEEFSCATHRHRPQSTRGDTAWARHGRRRQPAGCYGDGGARQLGNNQSIRQRAPDAVRRLLGAT